MKDLGRLLMIIGGLDLILSWFWLDYRQWLSNLVGEDFEMVTAFLLMGVGALILKFGGGDLSDPFPIEEDEDEGESAFTQEEIDAYESYADAEVEKDWKRDHPEDYDENGKFIGKE